jgi:hypothetical protein
MKKMSKKKISKKKMSKSVNLFEIFIKNYS